MFQRLWHIVIVNVVLPEKVLLGAFCLWSLILCVIKVFIFDTVEPVLERFKFQANFKEMIAILAYV